MLLHAKCTMSQLLKSCLGLFFMGMEQCSALLCCKLMLLQYVGAEYLSKFDHGGSWEAKRALKVGVYAVQVLQLVPGRLVRAAY